MLILSAKIQDKRTPKTFDLFQIQCSCGCAGTISVFDRRGQNIKLGFQFPEEMQIARNPVTAESVTQDAIE